MTQSWPGTIQGTDRPAPVRTAALRGQPRGLDWLKWFAVLFAAVFLGVLAASAVGYGYVRWKASAAIEDVTRSWNDPANLTAECRQTIELGDVGSIATTCAGQSDEAVKAYRAEQARR